MTWRPVASALALTLVLGAPARAQTAPVASAGSQVPKVSEGVAALRRTLEAYLTAVPFERGILRLDTDPAGQRLTIDPAPVLTDLLGSVVRFRPLRVLLAERADGNWDVSSDDAIDAEASPTLNGQTQSFLYRQDSQSFRGVFSPALATFTQGEARASGTRSEQRDAQSTSLSTIDAVQLTTSASPNPAGGADIEFQQTYDGYRQAMTFQIPEAEGTPFQRFDLEVGAGAVRSEGRAEGARTVAIRDLYALVLRHAEALEADPKAALAGPFGAELKTALREILPLWTNLTGSASADTLRVSSLYGQLTMAEARQDVRVSGIGAEAGFDIDMAVSKLGIESAFLPPWTATLLPQDIRFGFAMSGVDLAAPAEIALREIDFAKDPPLSPDAQARIAATFDPTKLRSLLKPSLVRAQDYDIAFSGAFQFAGAKPEARVAVDVGGFDRAVATLQAAAATQPDLFQAVGILQFAKGIGRPREDGRLEWIVDAKSDGSVSVNGTMLKGPDPEAGHGGDDGIIAPDDLTDPEQGAPDASDL